MPWLFQHSIVLSHSPAARNSNLPDKKHDAAARPFLRFPVEATPDSAGSCSEYVGKNNRYAGSAGAVLLLWLPTDVHQPIAAPHAHAPFSAAPDDNGTAAH